MSRSLLFLPLLVSACFSPPPAEPEARIRVSIEDFGAESGGGDDYGAFRGALDALAPLAVPGARPTLVVPAGDWHLLRPDSAQGLEIEQSVDIVCDYGATITGPDDEHTSKDLFAFRPTVGGGEDLEGVSVTGCTFRYPRTHSSNEQAHALSFYSGHEPGVWLRDIRVRDVTCDGVGSGDCVYLGADTEQATITNLDCTNVSRACVAISGAGSGNNVRRGFVIDTLRAGYDDECLGDQCDELSVDFEVSHGSQVMDVEIYDVHAPQAALDLQGVDGLTMRDIYVNWITGSRLTRATINRLGMTCRDGDGGDGHGYCVALFGPPYDLQITDAALEVSTLGSGAFYLREALASVALADVIYAFDASGLVRLNGGQLVRADILSDPLRVRTDGMVEIP